jgi:hypothetical protein
VSRIARIHTRSPHLTIAALIPNGSNEDAEKNPDGELYVYTHQSFSAAGMTST